MHEPGLKSRVFPYSLMTNIRENPHRKDIRDDDGDWNQIEEYIHERAEVKFTQGICPDCVNKHYPVVNIDDALQTS